MRLLIIGASGFLGRTCGARRRPQGWRSVTAGRSELPASPGTSWLDLAPDDPDGLAAMVAAVAPDVVVNCAGATAGDPDVLAAANVTGTYALARAMLLAGRPLRLVHLGSAAEYG